MEPNRRSQPLSLRLPPLCLLVLALAACGRGAPPAVPLGQHIDAPPPAPPAALVSHPAANHTCALDATGTITCWGADLNGQLGSPDPGGPLVQVEPARGYTALAVGGHTCALDRQRAAWCWGDNAFGQLGTGGTAPAFAPARVSADRAWAAISAGAAHTCGLDGEGRAWCWGDNRWGQLGDGTRGASHVPTPALTQRRFSRIDAGGRHTCGIAEDGTVLCWGDNFLGQLARGRSIASSPTPVVITGIDAMVSVSAGHGHTCALGSAGDAWCWGQNGIGQLGSGAPPGTAGPVAVAGIPPIADLHVGYHHTCAVDRAGAGWCWGANNPAEPGAAIVSGQLGGTTSWSNLPIRVGLERPLRAIAPGNGHTCALTRDGVVYCFGDNRFGQLGRPGLERSAAPVRVLQIEVGADLPFPQD